MATYPDAFRTALTMPHRVEVLAEIFYGDTLVHTLPIVSGSVSADRTAVVRRTATLNTDINARRFVSDGSLTPYGHYLKLYRGIRYPNNEVDLRPIFYGRIEEVKTSLNELSITASDAAADVVDARFEVPYPVPLGTSVVTAMTDILRMVNPGYIIHDDTGDATTTATTQVFEEDRSAALTTLASLIGAEWYADMTGQFHIRSLAPTSQPVSWYADAGQRGTLVDRSAARNRTGVYNAVIVIAESLNGLRLTGRWINRDDASPLRYGGPFGKVPYIFTAQAYDQAKADEVAANYGATLTAKADAVDVTCVPYPALQLGDFVVVQGVDSTLDGVYVTAGFTLPLDPETAMTITAERALVATATGDLRLMQLSEVEAPDALYAGGPALSRA